MSEPTVLPFPPDYDKLVQAIKTTTDTVYAQTNLCAENGFHPRDLLHASTKHLNSLLSMQLGALERGLLPAIPWHGEAPRHG